MCAMQKTHAKEKASEASAMHGGWGWGGEQNEPNEVKSPVLRGCLVLSDYIRPFNNRIKYEIIGSCELSRTADRNWMGDQIGNFPTNCNARQGKGEIGLITTARSVSFTNSVRWLIYLYHGSWTTTVQSISSNSPGHRLSL